MATTQPHAHLGGRWYLSPRGQITDSFPQPPPDQAAGPSPSPGSAEAARRAADVMVEIAKVAGAHEIATRQRDAAAEELTALHQQLARLGYGWRLPQ